MRKALLTVGLLFCSLGELPAQAAEKAVGFVAAVRGEAVALAVGGERRLAIKAPVYRGDTLKTGTTGRLQVIFADNTTITLGRRSEMRIADYRWDAESAAGAMKTEVKEGFFRVMGGAITKTDPDRFTTETPTATIGIRGSMYAGRVAADSLTVVFQGGKGIFVTNPFGRVEISRPGYGTRVEGADRPPQPPSRFSAAELADLEGEVAAGASRPGMAEPAEETQEEGGETAGRLDGGTASPPAAEDPAVSAATDMEGMDAAPLPAPELSAPAGTDSLSPLAEPSTIVDPILTTRNEDLRMEETQGTHPVSSEPPAGVTLTGRYFSLLVNLDGTLANEALWSGAAFAVADAGAVTGEATAGDGTVFPIDLSIPSYNATGSYTGPVEIGPVPRSLNLLGADRTLSESWTLASSLGDFALLTTVGSFVDGAAGPLYEFGEIAFIGVPSAELPAGRIDRYQGVLVGGDQPTLSGSPLEMIAPSDVGLMVNWHNGKVFGVVHSESATGTGGSTTEPERYPVFFLGEVDAAGQLTGQLVGSDSNPDAVSFGPQAHAGDLTFGQFYGRGAEGIGFTARGDTFSLFGGSQVGEWQVAGGALREVSGQTVAGAGASSWSGFAVGVIDDIDYAPYGRRFYMNADAAEVTLTLDRDAGTVGGSMVVEESFYPGNILTLKVGGTEPSAVIDDRSFIALLNGTVESSGSSGGLQLQGNYLHTADPVRQFIDHATWGYWEAAYLDPLTAQHFHARIPGTLWVAGEPTPTADLNALRSNGFVGTYLGEAEGVMIGPYDPDPALSQQMTRLHNGQAEFAIDFTPTASLPVQGSLTFDEGTLDIASSPGAIDTGGFSAHVSGASSSQVNGAFFGPQARSIGGNFDAQTMTGERFMGIFGGNRAPTP